MIEKKMEENESATKNSISLEGLIKYFLLKKYFLYDFQLRFYFTFYSGAINIKIYFYYNRFKKINPSKSHIVSCSK